MDGHASTGRQQPLELRCQTSLEPRCHRPAAGKVDIAAVAVKNLQYSKEIIQKWGMKEGNESGKSSPGHGLAHVNAAGLDGTVHKVLYAQYVLLSYGERT